MTVETGSAQGQRRVSEGQTGSAPETPLTLPSSQVRPPFSPERVSRVRDCGGSLLATLKEERASEGPGSTYGRHGEGEGRSGQGPATPDPADPVRRQSTPSSGLSQRGPAYHRDDVEPSVKPWRGASTTRNVALTSISGARLAMEASAERRALDEAIDRHGAPCAVDPERWFPSDEAGVEWAESACLDCAVFVQCGALAEAMQGAGGRRLTGVWGGVLRGSHEDQISKPRPSRAARTDEEQSA